MPLTHTKIYFYKDGGTTSWASEITVQYQDASGAWTTVPGSPTTVETPSDGSAPVIDVPLSGISTAQLRVVLTALPVVTASPVDTEATVEIAQATAAVGPDAAASVAVTAADGETVSRYSVTFVRTATVAPVILGEGIVGSELVATATADPANAALSYAWTKNGERIAGADSARYTPTSADVGAAIGLTAAAAAEGYSTASADSRAVVIASAGTAQPGTGEPASGSVKPPVNFSDAGTGGGALARTGIDSSWTLALGVGGLLVAFGLALTAVRRRHLRRRSRAGIGAAVRLLRGSWTP